MQILALKEDIGDDGEDTETDALLDDPELNEIEMTTIADETQSVRESFSENLIAVISANQRKKDPLLLNLVLSTDGYSKTVVVRAIVTEHSSQKIFGDLLSSFARQGVTTYAKEMVKVLSYSSERQVVAELSLHFKTASEKATLFDLIQGERTIEQLPDQLSSELKENLFHPSICVLPVISNASVSPNIKM